LTVTQPLVRQAFAVQVLDHPVYQLRFEAVRAIMGHGHAGNDIEAIPQDVLLKRSLDLRRIVRQVDSSKNRGWYANLCYLLR